MAKSKASSKPDKATPSVKDGRVTKPAHTPIAKSKELAKQTVSNIKLKDEKTKKGKKVKEPTPEPESESESESESDAGSDEDSGSDSGSSISDSDSDVSDNEMKDAGAGKAKTNGVAKAAVDDSSSEDDSEEDESEDEPTKAAGLKVNGTSAPKAVANKDESDSEEGSDDGSSDAESEDGSAPAAKRIAQQDDDTSEESESSDDEAPPSKASGVKVNGVAKKNDASSSEDEDEEGDSGSSVSSDDSEEEEEAPSKKRKAEEPVTPAAKKSKSFESAEATPGSRNLFVGNLSWNVDEEWLAREFEDFGEIVGCRLITDRESGRSKGYGYVEFADAEDAAKAHAEKNGAMVDGRELRVDFSQPRTPRTNDNTPQGQRAERAQRFGDSVGKPADTLFCGNLSFDCTNDMLSDAFSEFGTITRISLPRDRESDLPKGFGYVAFSSVEEAKAAFEAMQGTQLGGRPMRLDYAGPRPDNGGGGGGRGRGGRGGFGDRGGFGNRGGRGGFGDRGGRGGRGGARGGRGGSFGSTNRGGFGDFKGKKMTF